MWVSIRLYRLDRGGRKVWGQVEDFGQVLRIGVLVWHLIDPVEFRQWAIVDRPKDYARQQDERDGEKFCLNHSNVWYRSNRVLNRRFQ
jgi:hypothetical protein